MQQSRTTQSFNCVRMHCHLILSSSGQDYEVVQKTYLLQPSVSNLTVPISIIDDGIVENEESFEIVLQSSTDYQSGPDVVVTVSITDNDGEIPKSEMIFCIFVQYIY